MKRTILVRSKFPPILLALVGSLVFSQASCQTALKTPLLDEAPLLSPTENTRVIDLAQWDVLPKKALPVVRTYPTEDLWWISHLSISKEQLIAHFDRNELIAFRRPGGEKLAKVTIPKDTACLSSIHNEEIAVYSLDSQERFMGISLTSGKKLWSYEFLSQDPLASKQWDTLSINKEVILLESQTSSSYAYIALDVLNGKELWRSIEPCTFLGTQESRFLFYETDHVVCYLVSPGSKIKQLWKSRKLPSPHGLLFEQYYPMRIANINEEGFFYPTQLKLEEYGFLIRWEDGKIIQDRLKTSNAQDVQFDRTILSSGLAFHVTENHLVSCVDLATMSELWRIQFQSQQYLPPEAQKVYAFETLDILSQDETIWVNIQTFDGKLSYKVDKGSGEILFVLPYGIHEASQNTLLHFAYEKDSAYYLHQLLCFANDSGKLLWKIEPEYHMGQSDVLLLENLTIIVLRDQNEKIFGLFGISDEDKQEVFYSVPDSINLQALLEKDANSLFFWDEVHSAIVEIELF
jgi:outer membrane protein assembly factor BamB